jgi:hypothetical protein
LIETKILAKLGDLMVPLLVPACGSALLLKLFHIKQALCRQTIKTIFANRKTKRLTLYPGILYLKQDPDLTPDPTLEGKLKV